MLLEYLVINEHAAGGLMLMLPQQRWRGCLALPPQVRRPTGSLVEVVDMMLLIEALNGSILLCFAPRTCIMSSK